MERNQEKTNDFEWAKTFVQGMKWHEAVTYRKTTPHEYIVVHPYDKEREDFKKMFNLIEKYGVVEKFFGIPYRYLYLGDGYKYFSPNRGGWDDKCIILNRAKAESSYGPQ